MIKSSDDRKQYLINRLREIIAKKNGSGSGSNGSGSESNESGSESKGSESKRSGSGSNGSDPKQDIIGPIISEAEPSDGTFESRFKYTLLSNDTFNPFEEVVDVIQKTPPLAAPPLAAPPLGEQPLAAPPLAAPPLAAPPLGEQPLAAPPLIGGNIIISLKTIKEYINKNVNNITPK